MHSITVRSNPARLDKLLHDDFIEFGRNGRIYQKPDVLDEFKYSTEAFKITSTDFEFAALDENVVLITYRSAHFDDANQEPRHSLRSSIWHKTREAWKLRFHQGTPVE